MFRTALRHLKPRKGISAVISRQFHQAVIKKSSHIVLLSSITGVAGYLLIDSYLTRAYCAVPEKLLKKHEIIREDLPFFTDEEISKHDNKYHVVKSPGVDTFDIIGNAWEIERKAGIWVSYGVGVYDITNLIQKHGSPEVSILLAAGMALDPFWEDEDMKEIHDKQYIYDLMERCRVGNLKAEDNDD